MIATFVVEGNDCDWWNSLRLCKEGQSLVH